MKLRLELRVGQTLWFSGNRPRGITREVTVQKIGRRWAYLDNGHRIDRDTWIADGGGFSSPGCCYASREAWEEENNRNKTWVDLKREVARRLSTPDHLTLDEMRDMLARIKNEQQVGETTA